MSKHCELTGKGPTTGNLVSHSNIKTRTRWLPNLKKKKYLIPELQQNVSLKLSTHAIKTIDKQGGISRALLLAKDANLSERLMHIKTQIKKSLKKKS
jgi:large subunit ribosomal protein L28